MKVETLTHLTVVGVISLILFAVLNFMLPIAKDILIGVSLSLIIISLFVAFLLFSEITGAILLGLLTSIIVMAIILRDLVGALLFSSILITFFVFFNVMKH